MTKVWIAFVIIFWAFSTCVLPKPIKSAAAEGFGGVGSGLGFGGVSSVGFFSTGVLFGFALAGT